MGLRAYKYYTSTPPLSLETQKLVQKRINCSETKYSSEAKYHIRSTQTQKL